MNKQFNRNGYRRGFSRNRGFNSRRPTAKHIDHNKFINKVESVQVIEHEIKHNFKDFGFVERLQANIEWKKFDKPTPIQDQSIPYLMQNKDLIGLANTGTGKTLAFLLPLLNKVVQDRTQKVLIIAPTRELAMQIENELYGFSYRMDINKVLCIGGTNINRQIDRLKFNNDFVIGTPGRILDLAERKALNLASFNNVVVDEVDHMFDMGFAPDVKKILGKTNPQRQSLFFSATMDSKISELIKQFAKDPITVSVKTRDTAASVDQDVVKIIDKAKKIDKLHDLLIKEEFMKVLIFGKTKFGVRKLAIELTKRGFKADSIHGDKSQFQRQQSLKFFKEGKITILVATDVAARGLDIPNVSHVINYEVPETYEDYIHRIGRTGRANNIGKALTFI